MNRRNLPIFELEPAVVGALRKHSRIVLQAPTGSGKSTQVPQFVFDHGLAGEGEIVVLQPRRLATRMLAARVAQERNVALGEEVGYQIRLDKVCSARTRIRFVTEGVLLRQMLVDPELRGVSAIFFDEFHERHLYGDITLARALDLQEQSRPDLKLVVMSATLDSGALQKYLEPCTLLTSRGRTFPVEIEYLDRPLHEWPVWDAAATELERVAGKTEGDVLIFMPGSYEIGRTIQAVQNSHVGSDFIVLPLHGELPAAEQDAAVSRQARRKVIVSTNVAETSLTIEGVQLVIDSGLAKKARFDPHRGINTLLVEKISRASAEQRAGRAGRTAPGRCIRLWTVREHQERTPQELPEIRRLDLAEIVLTLKASGIEDVAHFRWLEPPDPKSLDRAMTLLTDLGALGECAGIEAPTHSDRKTSKSHRSEITPLGRRMLAFPVHPRYARMLLAADQLGCVPAAALIAALTQGRNLLRRSDGKQMQQDREDILGESGESDFFILMRAQRFAERVNYNSQRCRPLGINAVAAREAAALAEQFMRIARQESLRVESRDTSSEALQRCVLAGFPDQVAMRLDSGTLRCALVHGRRGVLARESVVAAPLLVASEVREVEIRGDVETLLTIATAIREEWLKELFPQGFEETEEVRYDPQQRRVVAERFTRFWDLVLRTEPAKNVPREKAAALLATEVESRTCPLKEWDGSVEQWIIRLNFVAGAFPELQLSPIGPEERRHLIEQICHGATTYKEIKDRPVWPVVKLWLPQGKQELVDKYAPSRLELPSGRSVKVTYVEGATPRLAARVQDLFGVEGELRIGAGRTLLTVEILAPNHRPVQVTQDLGRFWKETYPSVKRELARKYPKHEWR